MALKNCDFMGTKKLPLFETISCPPLSISRDSFLGQGGVPGTGASRMLLSNSKGRC